METLVMTLFLACVNQTIPNKKVIQALPPELIQVVNEYTTRKCAIRAKEYFDLRQVMEDRRIDI